MQEWVLKNREAFERDVLQDYCLAADLLREQFERLSATESVSFSVLRSLIGEPRNKGLLWRLKDKAHHIFLKVGEGNPVGLLLDWTLGYIFHESLKLMEDAHQRQYYAPKLAGLTSGGWKTAPQEEDAPLRALTPEVEGMAAVLRLIQEETCESMRRESARLTTLLLHARRLFSLYFAGRARHRPLARFLNDNTALMQRAFGDDYPGFIRSVYGDAPELLHVEAALSLLDSVRGDAATKAIEAALRVNPSSREALLIREAHGL